MGILEKAKRVLLVLGVLMPAAVCWALPSDSKQPVANQPSDSKFSGLTAEHVKVEQTEDKTVLAVGLFLQLIALVAVTMALAGHLSLPAKTKSTKP